MNLQLSGLTIETPGTLIQYDLEKETLKIIGSIFCQTVLQIKNNEQIKNNCQFNSLRPSSMF